MGRVTPYRTTKTGVIIADHELHPVQQPLPQTGQQFLKEKSRSFAKGKIAN